MSQERRDATLRDLCDYLLRARLFDRLVTLLTEPDFLEARVENRQLSGLYNDLVAAAANLPAARTERSVLALLARVIARDAQFIASHPTTLFQCLWNSCWHSVEQDDKEQPVYTLLRSFLTSWRSHRTRDLRQPYWLRSLRPPVAALGGGLRHAIRVTRSKVSSLQLSSDNTSIQLQRRTGRDGTVLVQSRDLVTGAIISSEQVIHDDVPSRLRNEKLLVHSSDRLLWAHHRDDGPIHIDHVTGRRLATLPVTQSVDDMCFSSDYSRLAVGLTGSELEGYLELWDLATGTRVWSAMQSHPVTAVAFAPDDSSIAMGTSLGRISLVESASGDAITILSSHDDGADALAFTGDGTSLVSFSRQMGEILVQDVLRESRLTRVEHEDAITQLCFSTDGTRLVSRDSNGSMMLFNGDTGQQIAALRQWAPGLVIMGASAFAQLFADEQRVVEISSQWGLTIWRSSDGGAVPGVSYAEVDFPTYWWSDEIVISPRGDRFLHVSAKDRILALCRLHDGVREREFEIMGEPTAFFSSDGRWFVTVADPGIVTIRNSVTGELVAPVLRTGGLIDCATLSADGRLLAACSDATIQVWETATMREYRQWRLAEPGVNSYSTASKGGTQEPITRISAITFAMDDNMIVTDSGGALFRFWDINDGRCRRESEANTPLEILASASHYWPVVKKRETAIFNARTGQTVAHFPVPMDHGVAHPNGRAWAGYRGRSLYHFALEELAADAQR